MTSGVVVGAMALSLLAWGAWQPTDRLPAASKGGPAGRATPVPSPAAGVVPPSKPLPAEFHSLLHRDVFLARRAALNDRKTKAHAEPVAEPQATFVLRGVTSQGGRVVAIVEDLNARRVLRLTGGDAVAGGTVRRVGLDGVEYVVDGRATRVSIGDTLGGEAAPAPAPTPVPAKAAGPREPKMKKGQTAELPPT